jgi:hypothetical protein
LYVCENYDPLSVFNGVLYKGKVVEIIVVIAHDCVQLRVDCCI